MEKLIAYLAGALAVVGIALGVFWLIWSLWTWVLPQVWPTGPESVIQPNYWLFVGVWMLVSMVGRAVFGSK